jgi:methionine-rich copper-binding protein CopC
MIRRALIASAGLLVLLLGGTALAGPASAHSRLIGSDPANNASLAVGPQRITLTFNEAVQSDYAVLNVVGPDEKHYWQQGDPEVTGDHMSVAVRPLGPAGKYTVNWRVTSADGHPVQGKLSFTLTQAGTGTPGPEVSSGKSDSSGMPWWPFAIVAVLVFGGGLAGTVLIGRKRK